MHQPGSTCGENINGRTGTVIRINGPIIHAQGMAETAMLEVVEVGPQGLIGEVIRVHDDVITVQVYENTSGLKPGVEIHGTGRPLSVKLGPGLIGTIYDGIQRPLAQIAEDSGFYIQRGEKPAPLNTEKHWHFVPQCKIGDQLRPGQSFGEVKETDLITHKILAPPDCHGRITEIMGEGDYVVDTVVCRVKHEEQKWDLSMCQYWPVRNGRPSLRRLVMKRPLTTGQRVIDTLFPITRGGTAAIPGGFGTGKTMTQHALAKWSDADFVVYIGCGERGNEMTEVLREFPKLIDPRSGKSLMERTVLIANTSNMPVAAREVSIYTGITIAEYYRDMGYSVAVMADSTSRWAEALRELSGRLEEMPADEGFPAYLPTRLAGFYERAGEVETLNGGTGSISVIGAVSPPGGDFSEPVTQHTSRFIRCFWALDRGLANARHYPAISWLNSYSEYLPDVENWWKAKDADWRRYRDIIMELLQQEVSYQRIAKLVGPDALPDDQRLILFLADVVKNSFLQQNSFDPLDAFCSPDKQVWMLKILTLLVERSKIIIRRGGTLADVRDLPVLEAVMRMKSNISNTELEKFGRLHDDLSKQLDAVGRRFS